MKLNDTFTSDSHLKNPAMKVSLEDCNSIEEPVNIFEFDDDDMEIDEMSSPGMGQVWKLPPQDNLPPSQLIKNVNTETSFTKVKSPNIAVITPSKLVKEKLSWLKSEQNLVDLDILIKTALRITKPEPQTCIDALEELDKMFLDPFMLKKQPEIVTTIRRLRKYVGPQGYLDWPDMVMREQFIQHIKVINHKADQIYKMFISIFKCQEGKRNFWKEFDISVREFKEKTDGMEENILLSMTEDPTAVLV